MTVWVEQEFKCDRYLATHSRYYIREMRIKAYTQLLESYRSVSLVHMAKSFGVGVEFMDRYDMRLGRGKGSGEEGMELGRKYCR